MVITPGSWKGERGDQERRSRANSGWAEPQEGPVATAQANDPRAVFMPDSSS